MELTPLISTFGIIAVAELGDKTQLAAMTLSTSYRAASVFVGTILAVVLVDGLSILAGTALSGLVPTQLIGLIGAAVFIGFGIHTLLSRETERVKVRRGKFVILTSFTMVLMMELGDKTQLSIITLAAKYAAPISVFLGMFFAYVLVMGIAVVVGNRLLRLLPPRYLRILTGAFHIFRADILAEHCGNKHLVTARNVPHKDYSLSACSAWVSLASPLSSAGSVDSCCFACSPSAGFFFSGKSSK